MGCFFDVNSTSDYRIRLGVSIAQIEIFFGINKFLQPRGQGYSVSFFKIGCLTFWFSLSREARAFFRLESRIFDPGGEFRRQASLAILLTEKFYAESDFLLVFT